MHITTYSMNSKKWKIDIPVGYVPKPPLAEMMTAAEALSRSIGITSGAKQAMERTISLNEQPKSRHTSPLNSPEKPVKVSSPLKGLVSDAMMQRIRSREKVREKEIPGEGHWVVKKPYLTPFCYVSLFPSNRLRTYFNSIYLRCFLLLLLS